MTLQVHGTDREEDASSVQKELQDKTFKPKPGKSDARLSHEQPQSHWSLYSDNLQTSTQTERAPVQGSMGSKPLPTFPQSATTVRRNAETYYLLLVLVKAHCP